VSLRRPGVPRGQRDEHVAIGHDANQRSVLDHRQNAVVAVRQVLDEHKTAGAVARDLD